MGGRYAQSWLFYGWGKNVSRETFSIVTFAFASVFCIGSSNSGVDNTAEMLVFCSTNRDTGILLCIRHFSCRKAFSTGNIVQYNRLQLMPVFVGLRSFILPFTV